MKVRRKTSVADAVQVLGNWHVFEPGEPMRVLSPEGFAATFEPVEEGK